MVISKSPGNDGLTKKFWKFFWDHFKVSALLSFKTVFSKKGTECLQKTRYTKTYQKNGVRQKIYKIFETYIST